MAHSARPIQVRQVDDPVGRAYPGPPFRGLGRMKENAVSADYFPPSQPWTERDGSVRLLGSKCVRCGAVAFPPHGMCPGCGAEHGQDEVELSPVGTLYTFSEIHVAPKGFATPYAVGYVDLPEGVRLFGQIEGRAADLKVGQPVAVMLGPVRSEAGRTVISYKFKGQAA
jgi:uncharacterized protein